MTMYGLLTFPSSELDLVTVTEVVAPCVTDPKKRVRHAALECLSILGQCMTAGGSHHHHNNYTLKEIVAQMNVGTMFDTSEVSNSHFVV